MQSIHSIPLALALMSGAGVAFATDTAKSPDKAVKPVAATAAATAAAAGAAATRPSTRDWAQVDTNRDGLVSPEEMEAYLAANPGPLKGK
jgi:hypothetical protein